MKTAFALIALSSLAIAENQLAATTVTAPTAKPINPNEWLAADADARNATDAGLGDGVSCDDAGCAVQMQRCGLVAEALRGDALEEDCEQGALAVWRKADGFDVEATRPPGLDRPWSPAVKGDGKADDSFIATRRSPRRALDATPSEADFQADQYSCRLSRACPQWEVIGSSKVPR